MVYKEIYKEIEAQIIDRKLKPGAKIPSARNLREKYNISHVTAMKVYRNLMKKGLITQNPGCGYFVISPEDVSSVYNRFGAIGCLLRPFRDFNSQDNYFNEINISIQQHLMKHGYMQLNPSCNIFFNDLYFREDKVPDIIAAVKSLNERVDGFLVDERIRNEHLELLLKTTSKPMVMVNRIGEGKIDSVVADNADGTAKLADIALRLKYNRFIVCQQSYNSNFEERGKNFIQALNHNGIANDHIDIIDQANLLSHEELSKDILGLLNSSSERTFIYAMGDALGRFICSMLIKSGIQPGKKVGVTGFGNYACATFEHPELCTVSIDTGAIGQQAVELLLERINHVAKGACSDIKIPTMLMIGETI